MGQKGRDFRYIIEWVYKMRLENILQINDWHFKKFLIVVSMIQLATWGTIGLDYIGLQIPILRPLITFIYLIFIPGIIILRCLKLHNLGNIETLLYAVGLSITTLMFIGFFINTVYPFFNISKPFSLFPLIITISIVEFILIILCYKIDQNFSNPSFINVKDILSPTFLILILILFLAVFGTYFVNFYFVNTLLMFLIFLISIIVLLIGFDYFIPSKYYPLTIFIIALSLLFHTSLITMYISGWDIQNEYHISNLVIENSLWDSTIPLPVNAMLSIVILAPIFSIISGMSQIWVFKIIYPLLFSLVPLGLYRVYQKQTNDKIAFLACFFFISLFTFYTEMLSLARQEIAELFLVLLMLLMIDNKMNRMKHSILSIAFIFSLGTSHYGLSFIVLFLLFTTCLLHYFNVLPKHQNMTNITKATFVSLSFIIIFSWYIYISNANTFNTFVLTFRNIVTHTIISLFNPTDVQGLDILTSKTGSLLHEITKYLHIISQVFITIGIIALLLKQSKIKMKFENEYIIFSELNYVLLLAGIVVPLFASSLNTTRLYQISLIFLAPFFVIGGLILFNSINNSIRVFRDNQVVVNPFKLLSVFLSIYLLFNSGWVYELANDDCRSISLNIMADGPHYNDREITGAKWLNSVKVSDSFSADEYRHLLLMGLLRTFEFHPLSDDFSGKDLYLYVGTFNIMKNEVVVHITKGEIHTRELVSLEHLIFNINKVYDNGGSHVYY